MGVIMNNENLNIKNHKVKKWVEMEPSDDELKKIENEIKKIFSDIPGYSSPDYSVKVPAAWLIENCNWKGFRKGDAGVHENHALVLCNYGNASGKEIYNLSEKIKLSVKDKFNIELEREVNVY